MEEEEAVSGAREAGSKSPVPKETMSIETLFFFIFFPSYHIASISLCLTGSGAHDGLTLTRVAVLALMGEPTKTIIRCR